MKPAKNIFLIGLALLVFAACTASNIQRSYEDESTSEEVDESTGIIVIIQQGTTSVPVYIPFTVNAEKPVPKTKVRTNSQSDDSHKEKRETSNNESVRNNTGQRNVKSRGR